MDLNCYCTAVLPLCRWAMERWVRGHEETAGFYSVKKKPVFMHIYVYLVVCMFYKTICKNKVLFFS